MEPLPTHVRDEEEREMFDLIRINFALINSLDVVINIHLGAIRISKPVPIPDAPSPLPPSPPPVLTTDSPEVESDAGNGLVPGQGETRLVSDEPVDDRVEELDSGKKSLFVLQEESEAIPLFVLQEESCDIPFDGVYPKCKFRLMGGGSKVEIVANESWILSDPRIRFGKLEAFNGRPISVPRMRMVSQARDRRSRHSVTLYRVPLAVDLCLAGRTCFFSDEVFRCLYVIALRSHRGGATRLRKISLLAVPRKGGKCNGNE